MNLEKATNVERLDLCRKYFFIGFACLPFVWLVNCLWFYKYAFRPSEEATQTKQMKKYVVMSLIGVAIYAILIPIWIYVYSTNRIARASWAEYLLFVIPLGKV